jgi:hypothetical protein
MSVLLILLTVPNDIVCANCRCDEIADLTNLIDFANSGRPRAGMLSVLLPTPQGSRFGSHWKRERFFGDHPFHVFRCD